jgi:cell division protease FtsH
MVTEWGFNDSIGKLVVSQKSDYGMSQSAGSVQLEAIDREIRELSDKTYANAMKILVDNREILENMTKALIEFETIDKDQVAELMTGKDLAPHVVLNQEV